MLDHLIQYLRSEWKQKTFLKAIARQNHIYALKRQQTEAQIDEQRLQKHQPRTQHEQNKYGSTAKDFNSSCAGKNNSKQQYNFATDMPSQRVADFCVSLAATKCCSLQFVDNIAKNMSAAASVPTNKLTNNCDGSENNYKQKLSNNNKSSRSELLIYYYTPHTRNKASVTFPKAFSR